MAVLAVKIAQSLPDVAPNCMVVGLANERVGCHEQGDRYRTQADCAGDLVRRRGLVDARPQHDREQERWKHGHDGHPPEDAQGEHGSCEQQAQGQALVARPADKTDLGCHDHEEQDRGRVKRLRRVREGQGIDNEGRGGDEQGQGRARDREASPPQP